MSNGWGVGGDRVPGKGVVYPSGFCTSTTKWGAGIMPPLLRAMAASANHPGRFNDRDDGYWKIRKQIGQDDGVSPAR
ncbi:MAG: hypothetical protein E3J88_02485 [Anaerolineales bacterium]|nr:MAG: hypothetical protein E3J88_02485 [Anaerolineales bacterium]